MTSLYVRLLSQLEDHAEGQGLVEYALIIALVSVALVAALNALNLSITGVFAAIEGSL